MSVASAISWTDAVGFATLSNLRSYPGDRFFNWKPDAMPVGPSVVGLGTGYIYVFEFRADTLVSFEIQGIPNTELEKMLRLEEHLLRGDPVTVTADHDMAATFATCELAPDATPEITFSDSAYEEYTFRVTLRAA